MTAQENSPADSAAELVARLRAGDADAAQEVFSRYVDRLVSLARSRLSSRLAQRLDPEDVVQSVYRSFFVRLREGQYTLGSAADLWRLLAAITIHKLHKQVEFHTAQKRSFDRELRLSATDSLLGISPEELARDPSPEEAMASVEELELLMNGLAPVQRRMLELHLQGHTISETAEQVQRSERAVRRLLAQLKQRLERRAAELIGPK
jgi:RNA polymerase sigma-70 factor (ECF subfamily)